MWRITDKSQLPPMNTYKHMYIVIKDDSTILHGAYRMTEDTFAFCRSMSIRHIDGKTQLHKVWRDIRYKPNNENYLHIDTLIKNGNLYVFPNTFRYADAGLMLVNDKQKISVKAI